MFLETFWRRYPGLLHGIASLLACYAALNPNLCLILPIALLFYPFSLRQCLALVVFGCVILMVHLRYQFPSLPDEGLVGTAYFKVESLSSVRHHFGKKWIYKGTLETFTTDQVVGRKLPCRIILPDQPDLHRPIADCSYILHGRLQEGYLLKIGKDAPWKLVVGSFSLAERRYHVKAALGSYIRRHVAEERSAVFLTGIITGDFDDRLMLNEFGRFGLQHIMAISGFHFAIIAAIFSLLFKLMMGRRTATIFLMALLSAYFLFLGLSPSIMRAWIAIMVSQAGMLWERHGSGLNSLGLALAAILIYDPLLSQHVGFQYSFAATAAILLLYSTCDQWLQRLFPKRSISQALQMDRFNQHGYLLLTLIRQAMALGLAVNLVTMPMMLFHFHKFPLMSLLYNLFFPMMVSLAMLLLILGLLVGWLPPLADCFHSLNSWYTRFMLDYTYNMPPSVDVIFRVQNLPVEFVIVYLTLVFTLTAIYQESVASRERLFDS